MKNMGYRTVLTLTGSTKREDLAKYVYGPDVVVESVAELCEPSKFLAHCLPQGNPEDDTVSDPASWEAAHA